MIRRFGKMILSLWSVFAFSDKVALLSAIIGFITFASSLGFMAFAYRADKEAYLFELQKLRAQNLASQVQASFESKKFLAQKVAATSELPKADILEIARLPEQDEVFAVKTELVFKAFPIKDAQWKKQAVTAIFRTQNGDLFGMPAPTPFLSPEDGTLFVVSNEGVLVAAAGAEPPNAQNAGSRPSVKLALQSGLTESTTVIESKGIPQTVAAYLEIPRTNLLVFAEVTLERLMAPFYKALRVLVAFGAFVILLGAVVSFFVTKAVARPARMATEFLLKIAHGDYTARPQYESQDEFATIFVGIEHLAGKIVSRENRLKIFGSGIQAILEQTSTWSEKLTPDELCLKCASISRALFKHYEPLAFGVKAKETHRYFDSEMREIGVDALPEVSGNAEKLPFEIPVVSRSGEQIILLLVFGVRPTSIWPETIHTVSQFTEAIVAYFERRAAAEEHIRKMQQDNEIELAATIQKSLVAFPNRVPNVEISRHYIPAEQMSGDWVAVFYNDENRTLRFYLGDASGHGIAPSIVTAVVAGATKIFQGTTTAAATPVTTGTTQTPNCNQSWLQNEATVLQKLAMELNTIVLDVGNNKIGMTMIMGSLHCDSGEITLLSLGHPNPVWLGSAAGTSKNTTVLPANPYLGDPDFTPPQVLSLRLSPNQGVLAFTDGLLENYGGKIKRQWLKEIANSESGASNVTNRIVERYSALAEERGLPADDTAMLAIRWLGSDTVMGKKATT